jgi:16S rRNA (cytosine967-C5)-methyltransferase
MTPDNRLIAAIEALEDAFTRRRPLHDSLKDWGLSHRFAGSKDRAAISTWTYDALRLGVSSAWLLDSMKARGLILATAVRARGYTMDTLNQALTQARTPKEALSPIEIKALSHLERLEKAPLWVQADVPQWLWSEFSRSFPHNTVEEGQAFTDRAPMDARVNTLKTTREAALKALAPLNPHKTRFASQGLRFLPDNDGRSAPLQTEALYAQGLVEIQDEGSQLMADLMPLPANAHLLDFCAGGGGKTLALAARMGNTGSITSTDKDPRRLAPIHERLTRNGVTNCTVLHPRDWDTLKPESFDGVFVDAPCTGTGTWRRKPDTKWRMRAKNIQERVNAQIDVLDAAAPFVKVGGALVYVTCSVLASENADQVTAFLGRHKGWRTDTQLHAALEPFALKEGVQLSPYRSDTDGFFGAVLRRV